MIGSESPNPIPASLVPASVRHLKAKSLNLGGETLAQHTWDVLSRLADQVRIRIRLPETVTEARFWDQMYWGCFLHDFGKAAAGFQERLQDDPPSNQWSEGKHRHEVLSLAFTDWLFPVGHPDRLGVLGVIAYHHKDMHAIFEKYGAGRRKPDQTDRVRFLIAQLDMPTVEALWAWLNDYREPWKTFLGFTDVSTVDLIPKPEALKNYSAASIFSALDELSDLGIEVEDGRLSARQLQRFILQRGLIFTADHAASAHSPAFAPMILDSHKATKPLKGLNLNSHQQWAQAAPEGSAILVAPTGSGKTESAIIWAARQLQHRAAARLFYTLPYQASMNAMYVRLGVKFFGMDQKDLTSFEKNNQIMINHGRAVLRLYQDMAMFDDLEPRVRAHKAKQLRNFTDLNLYPIQVFSPYQMLKAAYSLKAYETLLVDYTDGLFIFDEIHAYEAKRLALIITFMGWLARNCRTRFLVMTATLPPMVQDALSKALNLTDGDIVRASDEDFARSQRHTVHILDGDLPTQIVARVRPDVENQKAVLVCCNRVADAQLVYNQIRDSLGLLDAGDNRQIVLLHGRFNGQDRTRYERIILEAVSVRGIPKRPFVVVATQVVEVSLDVDFDTIYTDPAPLEALLQRFGRVNRGRKEKSLCPVHVFRLPPALAERSHPYQPYDQRLVEQSLKVLEAWCGGGRAIDEGMVTTMLKEIYEGELGAAWQAEYEATVKDFQQAILGTMRPFESASPDLWSQFYQLFEGIEVLPAADYDRYQEARQRSYQEAHQYLVSLSLKAWQVAQFRQAQLLWEEEGLHILEAPYSPQTGLDLETVIAEAKRAIKSQTRGTIEMKVESWEEED